MLPAGPTEHPQDHEFPDGLRSDLVAGLIVLVGVLLIAVVTLAFAWASAHLGIWPQLHTVTYFILGLCAVVLFVTSVITHMRNSFRAGAYLLAFWAIVLIAMMAMLGILD